MVALPLLLTAAMGAILVASIWWAFFGPPPQQRDVGMARICFAISAVLSLAAVFGVFAGLRVAPLFLGAGVLALCAAFWHARGDDGGGGGWDDDDGDGPIDWDRFDRERRDWDRPLIGA